MSASQPKVSSRGPSVRARASAGILIGLLLISVIAEAADEAPPNGPVPASFFGMQMHKPAVIRQPWPTAPFGAARLWDDFVAWPEVNTKQGVYDWELLDKWLAAYHEHGIDDLLYTFGRVPQWASSKPNDPNCTFNGKGQCDPPNDLKPDGTGPNQHWKDFVTAIATHNKNSRTVHIRYWEVWNEPHQARQWSGTNAQMIRMAQDARKIILSIDPNAVMVSPCSAMRPPRAQEWMENYLRDGGGQSADVIGFHGYVHSGRQGDYPEAANILPAVKALRAMMETYGQGSKPIFDTEASWGQARLMGFENDEDFQSGFLAQFYLLHWAAGVSRFYWYAWNNEVFGRLWTEDPNNPSAPGHLHKPGLAYDQVYHWMAGATMNPVCSSTADKLWTCGLTRSGGYEGQVVWSTGGDRSYTPSAKFKKVRDLNGNTTAISGGKVNIGFKPILLQNQ